MEYEIRLAKEDDIAFFDDKEIPLLFITTHEGYITIREDLVI